MKVKTKKNLLIILFAILFTVIINLSWFIVQDNKAYAVIKFDQMTIASGGGGGTPKEPLKLIIDAKHGEEILNFATISNQSVMGYNSINYPIHSRPGIDSDYNNLDTVIYMIKQLEKYAEPYSYGVRSKINNYVLGYIRSINKNYTGENEHEGTTIFNKSFWGFDYWQVVAGLVDCDFANKVYIEEGKKSLSLIEFFSSFLQSADNYNQYLHKSNVAYVVNNDRHPLKKLSDPLGSNQTIDLIHMIASMDGVYEHTDYHDTTCKVMLGNKHFQRDIVTWLGDLQTLAKNMAEKGTEINKLKTYSAEMGHIDFNEFTSQPNREITNFSSEDLLADIDAFNIANFYLNNNSNSLSDSIIGYYTTVNKDDALKGNRYSSFIFNVTRELNRPSTGNMEQDFRNEVCNAMNVKYENGAYTDYNYFSGYNVELLGAAKDNFGIRKYCAKLFCDYIIEMSHRF